MSDEFVVRILFSWLAVQFSAAAAAKRLKERQGVGRVGSVCVVISNLSVQLWLALTPIPMCLWLREVFTVYYKDIGSQSGKRAGLLLVDTAF